MSAIAGILYFHGASVKQGLIQKLTEAMKSRGPDEQTHWVQGSVALGHCMLRTTPESLEEHQPLMSQDKKLVLVWDGRLDNREELQRDLKAAGATLRDNSDAELALQGYTVWGEECPKRLLGDFAFAVWDARKDHLFCVRDHMGARPFYYTRNDRFFAFASEDEALLGLPGVSSKPNEELIAYLLVPNFLDFDYAHSWLEDVWAISAAEYMSVSTDGIMQSATYWHLQPGEENAYVSDKECQEAFLKVFGEAVRCRMRSLGNITAMMSGGMDSASIAAMVKRLLLEMPGKEFHTYSAISDHPETCVESQCIQSLTQGIGSNAHFVSVPSFSGMVSVEDLVDVAWSKPHPVDNSILLPAMMCLAASRDGHRVMLHGASGDLTTYIPSRYAAFLLRGGQLWMAWKECLGASRNNTLLRGASPLWLLLLSFWTAFTPGIVKFLVRKLRASRAGSPLSKSLINPNFAAKLRLTERMRTRQNLANPFLLDIQQTHIRVLQPPHGIASSLAGYERVAGQYGVELRDPWSDKRVVEFWLRLPLKYKVRNGWTKYLVRSTFAPDLAPEVRWRLGKEHLGWNFAWRLLGETHGLVSDTLKQSSETAEKYVDMNAVRKQYADYCVSKRDAERHNVRDIMILKLWLRRVF